MSLSASENEDCRLSSGEAQTDFHKTRLKNPQNYTPLNSPVQVRSESVCDVTLIYLDSAVNSDFKHKEQNKIDMNQ